MVGAHPRISACIVLVACLWGLVACGPELGLRSGETSPSAAAATAIPTPAAAATATPTPVATPTGGPAPAELLGTWSRVALEDTGGPTKAKMSVILTADSFQVQDAFGGAHGSLVVNGDEIDFFSAARCGLRLPEGVGQYQWSLQGGVLHFTPINKDPCSTRRLHFENQDFAKSGT